MSEPDKASPEHIVDVEDEIGPAWREATAGEHRWPVALVVVFTISIQYLLPAELVFQPQWIAPTIEVALLIGICIASPRRIKSNSRGVRTAGLVLAALMSIGNAHQAVRLIVGIVDGSDGFDASQLLLAGAGIWLTNIVVFALWYWELDRGGPAARANGVREHPDFLFPQMHREHSPREWEPSFFDYLYVAFTNATAFSPTDTLPLSLWAKMTMMAQAAISLMIGALVIARAIGILQ